MALGLARAMLDREASQRLARLGNGDSIRLHQLRPAPFTAPPEPGPEASTAEWRAWFAAGEDLSQGEWLPAYLGQCLGCHDHLAEGTPVWMAYGGCMICWPCLEAHWRRRQS